MTDLQQQVENLQQQLHAFKQQQIQLFKELQAMERELERLQTQATGNPITGKLEAITSQPKQAAPVKPDLQQQPVMIAKQAIPDTQKIKSKGLEDFIGTNLISKIGILITIIGIFIGAKYAIDKELISHAMRIILGYVAGLVLIGIALRLKDKYNAFSSILVGGGLAVIYFITYIAFGFYQLYPQAIAFGLMLLTTVATVSAALWYDQRIIAIIGQVGAYAIPFLLSDGSGNVAVLFTYITIVNAGLVVLSFKKTWRELYRIAFWVTWLIYSSWFVDGDHEKLSFAAALIFASLNFLTFYFTFLSYKIFKKEVYSLNEIIVLLVNALLYFFLCAYYINQHTADSHLLTWFALGNAVVHAIIGYSVYRMQLFDKTVVDFIIGLALLFITIAIPIELDGNWVTLLWTIEAILLFGVAARNKSIHFYQLAAPVFIIALCSQLQDWAHMYPYIDHMGDYTPIAFANLNFWLSIVVTGLFGVNAMQHSAMRFQNERSYTAIFYRYAIPLLFIGLLYLSLFHEIHYAWDRSIHQAGTAGTSSTHMSLNRDVVLMIYSCIFISVLLVANARLAKRIELHYIFTVAAIICSFVMLTQGLYLLGEMRSNYLHHGNANNNIFLYRYLFIGGLALLWMAAVGATRRFGISANESMVVSFAFNITLLTIICNEFIHWMDIAGYNNQYKLGLSIICGLYALSMLTAGIAKRKKHLRIGAMVLFGGTLIKLFVYDLASLSTISKTLVLVILGVLLLIASFLYNKYKEQLFAPNEAEV